MIVSVRNDLSGEWAEVEVDATHPAQAQVDALRWCFRELDWRKCVAAVPLAEEKAA